MTTEIESTEKVQVASLLGERTSVEDLKGFMQRYEDFKKALLKENDYAQIGDSKAIRKSGWYKLGVAFQISSIPTKVEKEWHNKERNEYIWHTEVQCSAMNGRVCTDVGTCTNYDEKNPILKGAPEHVIKAMAVTRASERALVKMLGAPDQAADDVEANKTNGNGNSKYCTCHPSLREATADFKGCRTCKKLLSPLVAKELAK